MCHHTLLTTPSYNAMVGGGDGPVHHGDVNGRDVMWCHGWLVHSCKLDVEKVWLQRIFFRARHFNNTFHKNIRHWKISSMELAVIWGNFGSSDLGYSDLACFDLGYFFFVKILTFITQHSQLGNSFSTHPNRTNLTKWIFYTLLHNNIHISTERIAWYLFLNFLLKMTFQPWL